MPAYGLTYFAKKQCAAEPGIRVVRSSNECIGYNDNRHEATQLHTPSATLAEFWLMPVPATFSLLE
jgi:hypothetical protein